MSNSDHSKPIDQLTGVQVNDNFDRFEQKFDIYCRAMWDPQIKSDKTDKFFEGYYMPFAKARKTDGFSQKDYAFRNAAWHVNNVIRDIEKSGEFRKEKPNEIRKEGFWDYYTSHDEGWHEPYPYESAAEATRDLKKVAGFCGVGDLGVCEYDERWMYKSIFTMQGNGQKPQEIPEDIPNVIVTLEPMDRELIKTVPSALSGAATGLGYTFDGVAIITLAQYIRNMGYRAYATLNDSALCIPLALQAGLGEVGRHGMLINENYRPRFRIGKIFTDMPLEINQPIKFGVEEFCTTCDRCAKACPPKAIPFDAPSNHVHSESNIKGVTKWTPSAEKCFKFWANQNTDCIICIRSCPYNRDFSKTIHRLWLKIAKSPFKKLALKLDDWFMDRGRLKTSWWWRPELKKIEQAVSPKRVKKKKK
ncbi:MAG: reductive dehalogenase [Kordiimonadaceae bacterium]|nr:reductive dehalogenase [Kordiimonadaceae bacterium]